jgi:hypothetical protein
MNIININIYNIFQNLYIYIIGWFYNMNSLSSRIPSMKPKTMKSMKKMTRSRLMQLRSSSSPYTEYETKDIQRKNFIITDDTRKSRLGKSVSFPTSQGIKRVEDINFCSFIREWYFDE